MFTNRYFNLRYWAARYWVKVGGKRVFRQCFLTANIDTPTLTIDKNNAISSNVDRTIGINICQK